MSSYSFSSESAMNGGCPVKLLDNKQKKRRQSAFYIQFWMFNGLLALRGHLTPSLLNHQMLLK